MRQVLSNLVENAIKYSAEETKVLVSTEERDGWVVVQVADQGPGIPTDELPNVFMKFFRSKNAKSSPIKGSGLGLYLAKYFTELHGEPKKNHHTCSHAYLLGWHLKETRKNHDDHG